VAASFYILNSSVWRLWFLCILEITCYCPTFSFELTLCMRGGIWFAFPLVFFHGHIGCL
jgi:hypothetical protein